MTILAIDQHGQIRPGLCPNCQVHVSFHLSVTSYVRPRATDTTSYPRLIAIGGHRWVRQTVAACQHCSKTVTLHQLVRLTEDSEDQIGPVRQVWPDRQPRELHASAPEVVRDLFAEGARAEAAEAYRAAAAMYRAAVEELCKDLGATGNNLFSMIEDLVKGVTREIMEDLHEARFLGKWSLHDGLEFSAAEVADVAELIAEAVHVLYVQPAERRAMRDARKARRDTFTAANP